MNKKNNSQKNKKTTKILGIICLVLGFITLVIGMIDFFGVFNHGSAPQLFYLCFIGIFLISVGSFLTIFSYSKIFYRFRTRQLGSAFKDIYTNLNGVECPNCGKTNESGASFCNNCGEKLTKKCEYCGKENALDAKYCDGCGQKLC